MILVVLAAGLGERFGGLKQLAPVGPGGESIMDYSIYGALEVGFERVVVVTRSEIRASIDEHVREVWPHGLSVDYVEQPLNPMSGKPGGTAMAVLQCRTAVRDDPFVVVNADDIYLPGVLDRLSAWLAGPSTSHALAAFRLANTMLPNAGPVTRALCERDADGRLTALVESTVEGHGDQFCAYPVDGAPAVAIDSDQWVSMNAWGLRPSIWEVLDSAAKDTADEVFLPTVIADALGRLDVTLLPANEPCFGVTFADEVGAVRDKIHGLIDAGTYPRRLGE